MNYIWVVEVLHEGKGRWHTTVGVGLDRKQALREKRDWQTRNAYDRFRITRYWAAKNKETR